MCVAAVLRPHMAKAEGEVQPLWYVLTSIIDLGSMSLPLVVKSSGSSSSEDCVVEGY